MTLAELRSKHPRLIYRSYRYELDGDQLLIEFEFLLEPDIVFRPTVQYLGVDAEYVHSLPTETLNNHVFHLGLIELMSYWKATCSPEIIIEAGSLNPLQVAWWQGLFLFGLGEFYFTNQIDFTQDNFLTISAGYLGFDSFDPTNPVNQAQTAQTFSLKNSRIVVPVGGGKDSATTLGILDKKGLAYDCLLLDPHSPAARAVCELSQADHTYTIKRTLDPQLFELNRQGYLNGHTPFSAYLAFASLLAAKLYRQDIVLVANERSANEGNEEFHGITVNHQYSKTFEFEESFQYYAQQYLPGAYYCSFMRPIYELQIAKLFSRFEKYFPVVRSCNVGQQQNIWCHHCPKCLFVFTMLFPFIPTETLTTQIFHSNLFENETLSSTLLELLGKEGVKPFECVGTYEETLIACYLSIKKYQEQNQSLPPVLATIQAKVLDHETNLEQRASQLLSSWNDQHALPPEIATVLKEELV